MTFGLLCAPQHGDTLIQLDRVECQRFTNFEDEEQARERDIGARGQALNGRMGFVTFGDYRWADGAR